MTLKSNLRVIMAKKRIDNIADLITLTNVSRNSLNKLWKDKDLDTIKLGTLVKICDTLDISISDLIEYIPDEK